MKTPIDIATIVGDGAMGTVCGLILAEREVDVRLWGYFDDQIRQIAEDRENRRFLPGHPFPDNLVATHDVQAAFADTQLVVSAVPCQHTRKVWEHIQDAYPHGVPVCSVTKGLEIDNTMWPTQIICDVVGDIPIAALSGPSIAPEVARGLPATVVAACEDPGLAELVQRVFSTKTFRVYTNIDLVGVELAGATKNIIALAAGIIDGIGAGDNAKAALLTRGLVEITRLGAALGAQPSTFKGLAGIGDLITTCISPVGRNRSAGEKIGRGMTMREVIESTPSVIEGIPTTEAVLELALKHNIEMPITNAVYSVLHGHRSPIEAIHDLMTRQLKPE
jgi:glycerol-3-phosphate dehydrogenase (NAD(P)+)